MVKTNIYIYVPNQQAKNRERFRARNKNPQMDAPRETSVNLFPRGSNRKAFRHPKRTCPARSTNAYCVLQRARASSAFAHNDDDDDAGRHSHILFAQPFWPTYIYRGPSRADDGHLQGERPYVILHERAHATYARRGRVRVDMPTLYSQTEPNLRCYIRTISEPFNAHMRTLVYVTYKYTHMCELCDHIRIKTHPARGSQKREAKPARTNVCVCAWRRLRARAEHECAV